MTQIWEDRGSNHSQLIQGRNKDGSLPRNLKSSKSSLGGLDTVTRTCHPSTLEAEAAGCLQVPSQPGGHKEILSQNRFLKNG